MRIAGWLPLRKIANAGYKTLTSDVAEWISDSQATYASVCLTVI